MKRKQIAKVFINLNVLKENGIWYSGVEGEGEYKEWYSNDKLFIHCFFDKGDENGEYKEWYKNGKQRINAIYKNGKKNGERKQWRRNGELRDHKLYKNDEEIKDYLR